MKKILLILLVLLLIVFGLSCSGLIPGSKTSLVTITVGSDQTASIKAEPATLAARITRFLARSVQTSSAIAAIPAVVASMRVTVSAPDMQTITVNELVAGQTSIAFLLEIPNGNARNFLLEGRDATNNVAYWNEFSLDLTGGLINQAVDMLFIGAATSYLYVDVNNGLVTNTGTKSSPLKTISGALALASPGTSIFIEPGTYVTGETFPLVMKVNTALVCLGANYTSIIDNSGGSLTTITGAQGAVVNGCRINSAPVTTTINDNATAITVISSFIFGNLVNPGQSPFVCIAVSASSRVAKSTITGCSFNNSGIGISITGGSPTIEFNTITGNVGTGISISGGIPVIQSNDLQSNTTGISIANVSPAVTNNTVHSNGTGILVTTSTAAPLINSNSIYCNTAVDLNASGTIGLINATLNSWDHDPPTVGIVGCTPGTDICPPSAFNYTLSNTAVPGGCP